MFPGLLIKRNDGPVLAIGPTSNDMRRLLSHRCDGRYILTVMCTCKFLSSYIICFNCHKFVS